MLGRERQRPCAISQRVCPVAGGVTTRVRVSSSGSHGQQPLPKADLLGFQEVEEGTGLGCLGLGPPVGPGFSDLPSLAGSCWGCLSPCALTPSSLPGAAGLSTSSNIILGSAGSALGAWLWGGKKKAPSSPPQGSSTEAERGSRAGDDPPGPQDVSPPNDKSSAS